LFGHPTSEQEDAQGYFTLGAISSYLRESATILIAAVKPLQLK
jgi:hypothetical protein